MSTDDVAAPGTGTTGRLPFDVTKAHQARMYDYVLGRMLPLTAVP